ncbi:MAG: hypothetical protein HQ581_28655 [Planctomycetes bacterium]|nr:hypothetical protein [Planctomycetota bacterium]
MTRMFPPLAIVPFLLIPMLSTAPAHGEPELYRLRYQFSPGEVLRWDVSHLATVRTTIGGTTQTAETLTESVKAWKVTEVDDEKNITFVHSVESVKMQQKLTGRKELAYDSTTDAVVPPGFEQVAQSIGVPLTTVTIDPLGNVIRRHEETLRPGQQQDGQLTIPLPEKPIAVGHLWSFPHEIVLPLQGGGFKTVKTRQDFELEEVSTGVATIRVSTKILTPISDPSVEAQLIQRQSAGTVRFDVDAGRILGQEMGLDRKVHDFQTKGSLLHYMTRFTEEIHPDRPQTARRL